MEGYFAKITFGTNTQNMISTISGATINEMQFGKKGLYYLALKDFFNFPLQARETEFKLLLGSFSTAILVIFS